MNNIVDSFDQDFLVLCGCINTRQAYAVSPQNAGLKLMVENLTRQHEVLIAFHDHPYRWDMSGMVAVRLQVTRHAEWLLGRSSMIELLTHPCSLTHLPSSQISSPELVWEVEHWMQSCPYVELRDFVFQILGTPEVGCAFFSVPASHEYHHCGPGGLALHSLEVARSVYAATQGFGEHERWLTAVAGLLHDVGKSRTLAQDGKRTKAGFLVSHETMGLELMAPALKVLEERWADGANAIRHMFGWLLRPGQRPLLPTALALRHSDMMSAARDNRRRLFAEKPAWSAFAKQPGPGPSSTYWLPSPP